MNTRQLLPGAKIDITPISKKNCRIVDKNQLKTGGNLKSKEIIQVNQ